MTLLVNEIHVQGNLRNSFILQVADQRITLKGAFHSNRKKLFKVPYLNACVGYFGLAQINSKEFLSSWLPNFIRHAAGTKSLQDFGNELRERLNHEVDKAILAKTPSGFHICGYNAENYPELWFVRNIYTMEGNTYKEFGPEYVVSEDFLTRDAYKMGFDGVSPVVNNGFVQYYANGDLRPFHSIWIQLDHFVAAMLSEADFKQPRYVNDLGKIAKWKMQMIASFYRQFAKSQKIGSPVDEFVLTPQRNDLNVVVR